MQAFCFFHFPPFMSTVGTPSLVTDVRDRLSSASSFSCWQSSQIGPVSYQVVLLPQPMVPKGIPEKLCSILLRVTVAPWQTLSTQSLSAPGAVSVRFLHTLCQSHTAPDTTCREDALQLPPYCWSQPNHWALTSGCSVPCELIPKQLNGFFLHVI